MRLVCVVILIVALSAVQLRGEEHEYYYHNPGRSSFTLVGTGGNIFIASFPKVNSFVWIQHGTHQPTQWVQTVVNGKNQIQAVGSSAFLQPHQPMKTNQWAIAKNSGYLPNYHVEVSLAQCHNDASKVEVVAKDISTGIVSYLTSSGVWAKFVTSCYLESQGAKRECFSKRNVSSW